MTDDIRREVVKALAYGKGPAEIAAVMEVSVEQVKSIPQEEINAKRAELKGKGYIR